MWPFSKAIPVENPEKLRRFLSQLENSDWVDSSTDVLEKIYMALNDLVYHEVLFYYEARKKQRAFSVTTRGLSVLFGTAGVIIPLLASANPQFFQPIAPYGYPLLAAAASTIAVNRMFGATGGHIRYVTAQLELERIITKFRLEWLEWLSRGTITTDNSATVAEAFELMNRFVDDAYHVIQEETVDWGASISDALREYENRLPKQPEKR